MHNQVSRLIVATKFLTTRSMATQTTQKSNGNRSKNPPKNRGETRIKNKYE